MNSGDTAWMLASSALVLLMTPGLAFFYGGMVRAKSVLNMMMMSFISLAIVPVIWFVYGYSMTFGDDRAYGLIGGFGELGLHGITQTSLTGSIPTYVFVVFQLLFGIVTVALISGAVADRVKFSAWAVFVPVWMTLVYFPVAHWVFAFDGDAIKGGWIANKLGALDLAGGTAVEINARPERRDPPGPLIHTISRPCCWEPVCCGSGGTASTPDRRWGPTALPDWL